MSQDKGKKNLKVIIGLIVVALLGVVGAAAFFITKAQKDTAAANAQINLLNQQLSDNNDKMNGLNQQLASAVTPEDKARLEQEKADLQKKIKDQQDALAAKGKPAVGPAMGGGGAVVPATPHKPTCHMIDGTKVADCKTGDSLCSCE